MQLVNTLAIQSHNDYKTLVSDYIKRTQDIEFKAPPVNSLYDAYKLKNISMMKNIVSSHYGSLISQVKSAVNATLEDYREYLNSLPEHNTNNCRFTKVIIPCDDNLEDCFKELSKDLDSHHIIESAYIDLDEDVEIENCSELNDDGCKCANDYIKEIYNIIDRYNKTFRTALDEINVDNSLSLEQLFHLYKNFLIFSNQYVHLLINVVKGQLYRLYSFCESVNIAKKWVEMKENAQDGFINATNPAYTVSQPGLATTDPLGSSGRTTLDAIDGRTGFSSIDSLSQSNDVGGLLGDDVDELNSSDYAKQQTQVTNELGKLKSNYNPVQENAYDIIHHPIEVINEAGNISEGFKKGVAKASEVLQKLVAKFQELHKKLATTNKQLLESASNYGSKEGSKSVIDMDAHDYSDSISYIKNTTFPSFNDFGTNNSNLKYSKDDILAMSGEAVKVSTGNMQQVFTRYLGYCKNDDPIVNNAITADKRSFDNEMNNLGITGITRTAVNAAIKTTSFRSNARNATTTTTTTSTTTAPQGDSVDYSAYLNSQEVLDVIYESANNPEDLLEIYNILNEMGNEGNPAAGVDSSQTTGEAEKAQKNPEANKANDDKGAKDNYIKSYVNFITAKLNAFDAIYDEGIRYIRKYMLKGGDQQ